MLILYVWANNLEEAIEFFFDDAGSADKEKVLSRRVNYDEGDTVELYQLEIKKCPN
jgi:hypothetical protein